MFKYLPLLACLPFVACSSEKCSLETEVLARAGKGAIDCGHVAIGGDRNVSDECVVRALEGGSAFYARYERRGTDSHVALGVARSKSGALTLLQYDGDPGGGGGDRRPVIDASICAAPQLLPAIADRPEGTPPFMCGEGRSLGRVCE
jgi:hypothetical protein